MFWENYTVLTQYKNLNKIHNVLEQTLGDDYCNMCIIYKPSLEKKKGVCLSR